MGRIRARTRGCKWNLLKFGGQKYKGKHGGAQLEAERVFVLFRCFENLQQPMGRGEQGDSHPIINEWGGA
jgi:hypothetical protein